MRLPPARPGPGALSAPLSVSLHTPALAALAQRLADWQAAQAQGLAGPGSPCLAICRMDARSRLCRGCLRHLDEIADWGLLPEAERAQIWRRLAERLQRLNADPKAPAAGPPTLPPGPAP